MSVIFVKYIKNNQYAHETDADVKFGDLVWCNVKDPNTGEEYEQLAIVTKKCDDNEAASVRRELKEIEKKIKPARPYDGGGC